MMTSTQEPTNTSLLATEMQETPYTNTDHETARTANAITPLADMGQTNGRPSTPVPLSPMETSTTITTTTITKNSISKIPHPLASPKFANKSTYPFQRAASLRLRGAKSNLLSNGSDNKSIGVNDTGMEHFNNININASTRAELLTAEKAKCQVTHDSSAAGRLSARRKSVLNSQLSKSSLTRSLSLCRSYHSGYKTDAHQAISTIPAAAAGKCAKNFPIKDTIANKSLTNSNGSTEAEEGGLCNGITTDTQVTSMDAIDGQLKSQHKLDPQDNQKETTTTAALPTTPSTTISTAAAATTATPARPATLGANGNSKSTNGTNSAIITSTPAVTALKSPKSPTSAQSNSKHFVNPKYSQPHYVKQALHTLPETQTTPKTPPVTPDSPSTYLEDDLDSMYSFATTTSGRSTMSCEHPYVARNGTTFSGRKMKYVVHCSNYAGQVGPDYLTPTQRAQRQIRRLKELLCIARQDLEQKDSEILRLTREVVELRLFKASLSSPEERSASSDAVTVREAELKTSQDVSPIVDMVDDGTKSSPRHIVGSAHHHHHNQHNHHLQHSAMQLSTEMQSSYADSGHFEDMTSSSVHSKDSYAGHTQDIACGSDEVSVAEVNHVENYELQRQELIRMYEQRIEELIRSQDTTTSDIKRTHNDKVEALLQKLAECNTRYADIVPDYEHAKERIRELEKQLEDLQRKLTEHEEKQNKMYLHMYQKGQEAERIARADQALELAHRAPNKVSINELLHQLQSTQDELENIRAAECRNECGSNHALLTAKEAISLWVLGARKTIYRRLLDAQKNRTHVDPEVTLQFLKSAVYYFLTDKENSQGHLQAIESILEFTEAEKQNISKARSPK